MPITDSYVKSAFDKMTGGDIPGVMAMIHDDAEWTIINPKIQSTPLSGKYGKTTFFPATGSFFAHFKAPLEWTLNTLLISGTDVVIQADGRGQRKDGKVFFSPYCWVIQFDDAESSEPKIVKVQSFLDSAQVKEIMESDV
ncbi:hypothetical protein JCM24511_09679 [Saitozyma sp. JCM 24511]|nr:hypothetical protein JCM24511_09679 [Saitozyma sp. JCM 24511]